MQPGPWDVPALCRVAVQPLCSRQGCGGDGRPCPPSETGSPPQAAPRTPNTATRDLGGAGTGQHGCCRDEAKAKDA